MALHGVAHKDLKDPQLHELKGASTAEADQVPFADGEGNSSWSSITLDKLDFTAEEVTGASTASGNVITKLDTLSLPGTATDVMDPAANWTQANQNTLNSSEKINKCIDEITSLQIKYGDLAVVVNNLLATLQTLGFITAVYPR